MCDERGEIKKIGEQGLEGKKMCIYGGEEEEMGRQNGILIKREGGKEK